MGKLLKEFKEFAFKGNVIDMAVGVVIGSAFTGIVTSVVNDLFTPLIAKLNGSVEGQSVEAVWAGARRTVALPHAVQQLTVGTLQAFLDDYIKGCPGAEVDYIHGEASLCALSEKPNAIGFLFDGMEKDQLFKTVLFDGALPRKTFSMGHAEDKRYYLEARKIK